MSVENGFHQLALTEEMLKIPDGEFWIGSDLKTSHPVTLFPNVSTTVRIAVTPDNLPSNRRLIRRSKLSTRSIFMQLGVEVDEATPDILDWTLLSGESDERYASIQLTNVNDRTKKIPAGMGVGALYLWNGKTFRNGELTGLVENGDIRMTGEEGRDWRYYRDNTGNISGIQYRINHDFRKYIAPSEDPIDLAQFKSRRDRAKIDRYYSEAPESEEPIDWITQTKSSIGLAKNVNAVIEPNLDPNQRLFEENKHRRSLLLRGGDEWPIRLELYSPTAEGFSPQWVLFRFAQAAA
jgi:hypothetical protein